MENKILHKKLVSYCLRHKDDDLVFEPFTEQDNGFSFFTFETKKHVIYLQSADNSLEKIQICFDEISFNCENTLENIYHFLSGAFQLFVWDKATKKLYSVCDYLGVGSALYAKKKNETIFFPNYKYFSNLGLDLKISLEGVVSHFGFGYQVEPFKYIYEGIQMTKGRHLYTFYANICNENKIEHALDKKSKKEIPETFKSALDTSYYNEKYFIGVTAGKDSLAILSSINKKQRCLSGNFGDENSADVLQGKILAQDLGLSFTSTTLCDADEFEYYAYLIANASGGLATCSYVDMMKFVDQAIPNDYAYLMGEGGESIRSFFDTSEDDIEVAMNSYITPKDYLQGCLIEDIFDQAIDYPKNLTDVVIQNYQDEDLEKTLMQFYRFGRMPGNFSNRHRILTTLRDKCIPFLNNKMIEKSFSLDSCEYNNDGVHRYIIENNDKNLLPFFDSPKKMKSSVQNWENRIKGEIGERLILLLERHLKALDGILEKQKVLNLAQNELLNPGRGTYFLLRVLSLCLFIDKNRLSK